MEHCHHYLSSLKVLAKEMQSANRQGKMKRKKFWKDAGNPETHRKTDFFGNGRGERIRTSGLYVPNVALYQAKLHPEKKKRKSIISFRWEGRQFYQRFLVLTICQKGQCPCRFICRFLSFLAGILQGIAFLHRIQNGWQHTFIMIFNTLPDRFSQIFVATWL